MRKLTAISLFVAVTVCMTVQAADLREKFSFGINYAWQHYSGDFGGISGWAKEGVALDPDSYATEINDMASHGIKVIRWWVWPELWTDAITFSADGTPQPLGQAAIDDGLKALELAANANVRIMFCLFSFDGFRPTREEYGIKMTGYRDIVVDNDKRAALMNNVVRPFAAALQGSPHIDALHSWDVINEPEWAITGENKFGGQSFDPNPALEPVSHDQMEDFLADTIAVLREETPDTPVSIGSAAMKWAKAWTQLDVDFYQIHIYDWVNDYWPYSSSPDDFGIGDKPVIMGEYPVEGLRDASHEQMLSSWYNNGYAGAIGWDYRVTHATGVSGDGVTAKRIEYLEQFKRFQQSISEGDTGTDVIAQPGNGNTTVVDGTDPTDTPTTENPDGTPAIGAGLAAPLTKPGTPNASIVRQEQVQQPALNVETQKPAPVETSAPDQR